MHGFFAATVVLGLVVAVAPLPSAQSRVPETPATAPPRTDGAAVPRMRIGLDANPKATSDFLAAARGESIRLMLSTGANHAHYAKLWSELETASGLYDTDDVAFVAAETGRLRIAFNLRVINAGARSMPDAYEALAWDSPEMVAHVVSVIEKVAPLLGDRPWLYAVGNEIDTYFATRPAEVPAYARMLAQVKPRVRALHRDVFFATSFQTEAAPKLSTLYAPIVATLDSVSFMYYPLTDDFIVRSPSDVTADIGALVAASAPRPIYLQEIGYPTSALLGSSPEAQATFVRLAFETMRSLGPAQVLGATYLFQADFPEWVVAQIADTYGAATHERFREYIRTLGLRDDRDRPKPAWAEFIRQAALLAPQR